MTHLGELLRLHRAVHNVGLRELANEIGIHFNTLNRFERTDTGMTADNFLKVLGWLLTKVQSAPGGQSHVQGGRTR